MVEEGSLPLTEKPGIDVEINEKDMRRRAIEGVPFFEQMRGNRTGFTGGECATLLRPNPGVCRA